MKQYTWTYISNTKPLYLSVQRFLLKFVYDKDNAQNPLRTLGFFNVSYISIACVAQKLNI